MGKAVFYAQSGGVTAVINATACGIIETVAKHPAVFSNVLAGNNGILGALHEELIDVSLESPEDIAALRYTPAGAFGSCRHKLKSLEKDAKQYERLIEVFAAHDIGYFFYNGGGDSQDTAHKMSQMSEKLSYPLICIGVPKTIDNDLPLTDNCPGFGSVAKYVAVSIREAGFDVASMAATSTKVFIMEVMGRHTGWIAAASGLAAEQEGDSPHIILFPEIPFDEDAFCARVKECVDRFGHCSIVASEGVQDKEGKFLSERGTTDSFGHKQLGGVAPLLADIVKAKLGYKYHWAVLDYLQRSARHIASSVDVEQAYALGQAAVQYALEGKTAVLPVIRRLSSSPYKWDIVSAPLADVANIEKSLPRDYISEDGFGITARAREYLLPLIQGEAYPPYKNGLPDYVRLKRKLVNKKLDDYSS